MATFLFCWELGGWLGHVGRLAPLASGLAARGHEVAVALREPRHGPTLFPGCRVLTAPQAVPVRSQQIVEPSTFADILHNAGAGDPAILNRAVAAWREILDLTRPNVLVLDFSPLALVAAQGHPTKTVLVGSGHSCPPDVTPLPDCCPWRNSYPDRLLRTEQRVLGILNQQLIAQGEAPLERVGQLFTRCAANLIATFPELDHYPNRPAGNHEYVGTWSELPGEKPCWPMGDGPRVFAYLKPASLAGQVLSELDRRGLPTVAFVPDGDEGNWPSVRGSVTISRKPIDIARAAGESNLAVLNSGQITARFLLAGKPILTLPLNGEQSLMAANIVRLGAGEWLHPAQVELLPQVIDRLLGEDRYRAAAAEFAQRYGRWTPERQIEQVVERLDQMASG